MDIKNLIKNIDFIKDGTEISNDNLLLKNYDKNNDSIFQRAEVEALKSDIEKAAGDDGQLSENEAAEFLKTGNFIGEKYISSAKDFISASINSMIAKNIASQMHSEIENNFRIGSLSSKKFEECLNKIDSNNIVQVMDEYKKISKAKESLPEAIINEVSNSTEKIREVLDKIFDALILNIDGTNYDIEKLKKEYNEAKKTPQWTDDNEIIDIAYQMAKSDKNITTTEEGTVDVIKTREEKASQTQQDQINSQGGVSNILDDIAGVFGGLTQEKVDEILKEQQSRAERLNAVKDNPVEFAKLFKEFYGVEYSKTAVANYEKQEELYSQARDKYSTYSFLIENFKDVLEVESFMDKDTNVSKKKMQEIYNKCYELLSSMFGKETIDSILAQSDIGNPPLTSRKYEVLRPLVLEIVKMAEDDWNSFSNGKSLEDFKTERDASYHAAFGYENDALLEAEDWVASQQKRLTAAQIGSMVLSMSAGIMFGGPMALLMGAVSYADPVGLVENATDANGMTKEDWNAYIDSKTDIENLGWMALGIATGGLGNLARSATLLKFVKLKGLKSLLVSSGQNLDDLIKAGKLPKELSTAVESAKKLADVTGFLVEASSDIITTALLQKEGLTSGDWVLSLAGALAGTSLVEGLRTTKNIDEGLSKLKEALPDFNWTKEDATKFMQAIGNKVLELNDKANAWANTPTAKSSINDTEAQTYSTEIKKNIEIIKNKALQNERSCIDFIEYDNMSKYGIKNYEDLINSELISIDQKMMIERIYSNAERQGYKDFLDANLDVLMGFAQSYKNIDGKLVSLYEELSAEQLSIIKYAKEQLNKGLIEPKYLEAIQDRINMSTPIEIYKYVNCPEQLPDKVYSNKSEGLYWTREQCLKEIENVKLLKEIIDKQTIPNAITVYRVQGYSVMGSIKFGDSNLADMMQNAVKTGKTDELIKMIKEKNITVFHENHIGTSLTAQQIFSSEYPIKWEINVPKNSKALFIESAVPSNAIYSETEILLQMNSGFKIIDLEYKNNTWYIKADLVQDF